MFWLQRQVIMKVDLTQHKQTHSDLVKPQLWNMHTIEFLHVTGWGLDIRVQGHFLKCAPPPPSPPLPFLISSIPKQKRHLWEKFSGTYFSGETCMKDSLVISRSLKMYFLKWQHKTIYSKQPVQNKVHATPLTQTLKSKLSRDEALLHLQNQKQCSSLPFDLAVW